MITVFENLVRPTVPRPASSARITSFLPVDATPVRHPSPATRRPPPAARHPPPATSTDSLPRALAEGTATTPTGISNSAPRASRYRTEEKRGEDEPEEEEEEGSSSIIGWPRLHCGPGAHEPCHHAGEEKRKKLVRSMLVVVTRNTKSPRTPPRNLAAVRATQSPEKNAAGAPTSREIELAKLQSPNSPNFPSFHDHTSTTHPQHPRWGAFPVTTS